MDEDLLLRAPEGAERRDVPSGAARLTVEVLGGAPWITALHPGVGDRRIWRACIPAWQAAGYGVVAWDRRGFGDTTAPAEPHDDLHDAVAVLDAVCGPDPVVVVGNSDGGALALRLAIAHPDRVRALVLIAPSATPFTPETWPTSEREAAMDEQLEAAEEAGAIDRQNELEAWYWLDGTGQAEQRVTGPARELFLDMNGRALRSPDIGESTRGTDLWEACAALDLPTLIICGEHDLPGINQSCKALADRMPQASLQMIAGSAHCPQLDQPAAVDAAVTPFLAALPSTRRRDRP